MNVFLCSWPPVCFQRLNEVWTSGSVVLYCWRVGSTDCVPVAGNPTITCSEMTVFEGGECLYFPDLGYPCYCSQVTLHGSGESGSSVDFYKVVVDKQGNPQRVAVKRMPWTIINKKQGKIREVSYSRAKILVSLRESTR